MIAALLPMAFVSGLMGPYMSPIPINASMGMLLSLAIAFVVTPWLARLWMKATPAPAAGSKDKAVHAGGHGLAGKLGPVFQRVFRPLLDDRHGARNRGLLGLAIAALIAISLALPATGLVLLKMLPFDNKSEFQVIVDMPAGTPLEQTAAVLHELGAYLATVPEVTDYQAYAGTAAPINFNGLVRQYYLRAGGEVGDLQVNLVDKHHRSEQSHAIATRVRPALQDDRPALRRQRQGRRSAARPAGALAHRGRDLRPRGRRPPAGRQGGARGVRGHAGRGRRRRQQHRRGAEEAADASIGARRRCSACRSRPS